MLLALLFATLLPLLCPMHAAAEEQPPAPDESAERFTMNVKDIELTELLQMIGTKFRVSIVSSSDVAGKVSVNFYDVSLDEALNAILTVNGLAFSRHGRVIHVHKPLPVPPPPAPAAVEKISRTFQLTWADPAEVVKLLTEFKSESGKVVQSADSDIVIVKDDPPIVEHMTEMVATVDRKPRQILITTWVMELGDSDLQKLGMNWASLDGLKVFEFSAEGNYARDGSQTTDGSTKARVFNKAVATSVDLRAGVLAENQFNLLLSFFDTLTKSKVVSEPRIMTLENKPANIIVGTLVPIPLFDFAKETGARILSGFQEQKVGTEVIVTPRVNKDGYITLEINPKVEQIVDYIIVAGEKQRPIVSTRQAKTTVMVKSGDTVVIGGLRDESHTTQGSKVPFLHSIPIIGWLFKNKTEDNRVTDLTIFIRPELFDENNPLTVDERAVFDSFKPMPLSNFDDDPASEKPKK